MHNILGGSVQTLIRYFLLPNVLLCYIKALMPTYGYLSMAVLAPISILIFNVSLTGYFGFVLVRDTAHTGVGSLTVF